jgi:hypothetical protein
MSRVFFAALAALVALPLGAAAGWSFHKPADKVVRTPAPKVTAAWKPARVAGLFEKLTVQGAGEASVGGVPSNYVALSGDEFLVVLYWKRGARGPAS